MVRKISSFSYLFLLMIFSGCQMPTRPFYPIGATEKLTENENYGVVVIGQSMDWNKAVLSTTFLLDCDQFFTEWYPFETELPLKEQRPFRASESGCLKTNPVMRYSVLKIPSGKYALHRMVHIRFKSTWRSSFFEPIEDPKYETLKGPKFEISKGEVVYIGDITFSIPNDEKKFPMSALPVRIKSIGREDRLAREALEKFPDIPQNMVYRPMIKK